ncbi:zf-CCHC domain-containing protein [Cephalotus follicularis]|uniref:Zf-CCHC domain-containing protein n=1 Tax=Cephalotus follicularis TaxID=3775 RepID=A0A1Q3B018_CEPFO|nr:zf-CCHC domain-containing protein [Cephalotus follicularis]
MELGTFVEVAQKARLLESISNEDRAERARRQQSKQGPTQFRPASSQWQGSDSLPKSSENQSQQTATQGTPSQGSNVRPGVCFHCGRTGHQVKDCRVKKGLCMKCGASGHLVRDCPEISMEVTAGPTGGSGAAAGPSKKRDTSKGIMRSNSPYFCFKHEFNFFCFCK